MKYWDWICKPTHLFKAHLERCKYGRHIRPAVELGEIFGGELCVLMQQESTANKSFAEYVVERLENHFYIRVSPSLHAHYIDSVNDVVLYHDLP